MKKILVIDDESVLRKTISKLLQAEGFCVLEANNGTEGVNLARSHDPDVILCDIMMPDLDGYEVLKILQQDQTTAMIPLICLTAREERAVLRRVMELGANDYLTKPFTRGELLGAITTQITKQEKVKQQQTHAIQYAIAQLNDLVYYDSLTNLPNRLLLRDRFEQALKEKCVVNRIIPVVVLSLDQLNSFSNSLGTDYTDLLLQAIAERLILSVGVQGTVARLNSEQFALILAPVADQQVAQAIIESVFESLSERFQLMQYDLFMTSSIGIALYPQDGQDIDILLKAANAAMHQAKKRGGNHYQFYTPAIQKKSFERLMQEMQLHQAIERNELILYYQPQLDLKTKQIVGAEALVRWQHPEQGFIPPMKFIPLAEETGLIVPIDEWVFRTACQQLKTYQLAGFSGSIAVNLSGKQFNQPGLIQWVTELLKETNLDPTCLELELTESILVQNPENAIATLNQLKNLGVQLSLDDFGTGYSSFSYLQKFPFDILKIDRSFVQNLTGNEKNQVIINSIIELAHSLNLKVIAEGVETPEQQNFLRDHHCDRMQGYLFSPPITSTAFEQMLNTQVFSH